MKIRLLVPFLFLTAALVFSQEVRVINDTVVYFDYDAQMDSVRTMRDVSGYSSGGYLTSFANYSWDAGNITMQAYYSWDPGDRSRKDAACR